MYIYIHMYIYILNTDISLSNGNQMLLHPTMVMPPQSLRPGNSVWPSLRIRPGEPGKNHEDFPAGVKITIKGTLVA